MTHDPSNPILKQAIQDVITQMMDRVMDNVLVRDPFLADIHRAKKPLYAALVPDEIFKGSHFERRFVTPFGGVWEKLAVQVATQGTGTASTQHRIDGFVPAERLRRINETLNRLEHPRPGEVRIAPNWDGELEYILDGGGELVPVPVQCDVYCVNQQGRKWAFELKAPLPNSDQSKVSKEKLLKLHAMQPRLIDGAYFALPYNPYGERPLYAWTFPSRWFNMHNDSVVLMGEEFWDKIGGEGAYRSLIEAVNELGPAYRDRIYREFLGIEPPTGASEIELT